MQLTRPRHQFSEATGCLACPRTSELDASEWHVRPGIHICSSTRALNVNRNFGRNFSKSTEIAEQTLFREDEPQEPNGRSRVQLIHWGLLANPKWRPLNSEAWILLTQRRIYHEWKDVCITEVKSITRPTLFVEPPCTYNSMYARFKSRLYDKRHSLPELDDLSHFGGVV